MSLDKYVFNGQRWQWKRISTTLEFGPVDNLLRVTPEDAKPYEAFLSVPAEFVKFIYDLLKDKPVTGPVRLYLDEEVGRWAFGFTLPVVGGELEHYDLWYYTESSFPAWARR